MKAPAVACYEDLLLPLTLQISPTHNMHLNVPKLACLIGRGVPGTNAKLPILADAPTSTDRWHTIH